MEEYTNTWFKSLVTKRVVKDKLDRVMANDDWCNFLYGVNRMSLMIKHVTNLSLKMVGYYSD